MVATASKVWVEVVTRQEYRITAIWPEHLFPAFLNKYKLKISQIFLQTLL
jgi:hypothetical protein